jgi:adenine phosphoribosyltransferase
MRQATSVGAVTWRRGRLRRPIQISALLMAIDVEEARRQLTARFPLVNDHPDVAGVLRRPELLALLGPALAAPFRGRVSVVMAPEARGPILGALVAGLALARKQDHNHPGSDRRVTSSPTWRGTPVSFEARSFDLEPDDRVLIVDDWITTGSTVDAMRHFVAEAGANVVGVAALVNKADEATRRRLLPHTLVDFDDLIRNEDMS